MGGDAGGRGYAHRAALQAVAGQLRHRSAGSSPGLLAGEPAAVHGLEALMAMFVLFEAQGFEHPRSHGLGKLLEREMLLEHALHEVLGVFIAVLVRRVVASCPCEHVPEVILPRARALHIVAPGPLDRHAVAESFFADLLQHVPHPFLDVLQIEKAPKSSDRGAFSAPRFSFLGRKP